MSDSQQHVPQPPQAPSPERHFSFHRLQAIGVPLILVIPLLAVFGVFGETIETSSAEDATVAVAVEYPSKLRYKTIDVVSIEVENLGTEELGPVTVLVPNSYLEGLSNVTFSPAVDEITGEHHVVELTIPGGERRLVEVEVQGERYGGWAGGIEVETSGSTVSVAVETFVLP